MADIISYRSGDQAPYMVTTPSELILDNVLSYTSGSGLREVLSGDIVIAGPYTYEVVGSGETRVVTTAGSVKLKVLPINGTIYIDAYGLASGANIGAAMEEAWDDLRAGDGGTIQVPPGSWPSDNRTFTRTANTISIEGHGDTTEITPSNPVAGTFMWDFEGTNSSVLRMQMRDIGFEGSGSSYNGVRVAPSNYVIFRNVQGRNINGTAFQFERNYNSQIDVETYFCGDEATGRWALLMTGDATSGQSFNDCRISGAMEQDELGWKFEGCSGILRTESSLKVHGSITTNRAVRAIEIHRCTDFDISVDLTRGCTGDGFIHISDGNSGDSITLENSHANAPTICQGRLNIRVLKNFTVTGNNDTFDLVTIDCAASNSEIIVDGVVTGIATPSGTNIDYNVIGLAAPGLAGVFLDLSTLIPGTVDTTKLIDDRRTAGGITSLEYKSSTNRIGPV